jgi:rhodanese-related sulfurtransferase
MKEVTVAELKEILKGSKKTVVLDVRQQAEFDAGHIEGSILIPLDQLPGRFQELSKDVDIVVACRSGGRSARAVDFLELQGFTRVANLVGGNLQWQAESC